MTEIETPRGALTGGVLPGGIGDKELTGPAEGGRYQKVSYEINIWQSMPLFKGFVTSLFYIPPGALKAHEAEWGVWARAHPKKDWPIWLNKWIEKRRAEKS